MSHAVILERWQRPTDSLLVDLFARHGGLPPPVAKKLAERASGIVWENAPRPSADAIVAGLRELGFPAQVIAQSHIPPPSSPRRVHLLALDDEHLGVQLRYTGPLDAIAWNDVLTISAGAFQSEKSTTKTTVTTLSHGMVVVTDEHVQVDIARDLVVELFALPLADRTQLLHIRLHSQEVNYAQSMGGTIQESWREKFSMLVAKLGLRAEQALVSEQTEALVASGMHPQLCTTYPYFESEAEFASHNRWLLARKRAGS
jgi:hypothetical protein